MVLGPMVLGPSVGLDCSTTAWQVLQLIAKGYFVVILQWLDNLTFNLSVCSASEWLPDLWHHRHALLLLFNCPINTVLRFPLENCGTTFYCGLIIWAVVHAVGYNCLRLFCVLSGYSSMIGQRSKKVLGFAVKNKKCRICNAAKARDRIPKVHSCRRNWEGSAKAMEPAMATEMLKKIRSLGHKTWYVAHCSFASSKTNQSFCGSSIILAQRRTIYVSPAHLNFSNFVFNFLLNFFNFFY